MAQISPCRWATKAPLVVDTGAGKLADKVIAAIRKLSDKPIQFIVNTSFHADHTGGNVKLHAAGEDPSLFGSFFSGQFADAGQGRHDYRSSECSEPHGWLAARRGTTSEARPSRYVSQGRRRKYHNGEAVESFTNPMRSPTATPSCISAASDVIVTGDIFTTTQYPFIDVKNGGT